MDGVFAISFIDLQLVWKKFGG